MLAVIVAVSIGTILTIVGGIIHQATIIEVTVTLMIVIPISAFVSYNIMNLSGNTIQKESTK